MKLLEGDNLNNYYDVNLKNRLNNLQIKKK